MACRAVTGLLRLPVHASWTRDDLPFEEVAAVAVTGITCRSCPPTRSIIRRTRSSRSTVDTLRSPDSTAVLSGMEAAGADSRSRADKSSTEVTGSMGCSSVFRTVSQEGPCSGIVTVSAVGSTGGEGCAAWEARRWRIRSSSCSQGLDAVGNGGGAKVDPPGRT